MNGFLSLSNLVVFYKNKSAIAQKMLVTLLLFVAPFNLSMSLVLINLSILAPDSPITVDVTLSLVN